MATVSNVSQQLIAESAMQGFMDYIVPITAFSFGVASDAAVLNDIISVPTVKAVSGSSTYSYTDGIGGSTVQVVGVPVTLDTLLYQSFNLTDTEAGKTSPETLEAMSRAAGQQLASDFVSASFAKVISNANFVNSSSYTSGQFTASAAIIDCVNLADVRKWPEKDRSLIAGTTLWKNLLSNTNFTNAASFGSNITVNTAYLPSLFGFLPIKTTVALPASDAGFICRPEAMIIAMGAHRPANANNILEYSVLTDEQSGIKIGFRHFYDATKATSYWSFDVLAGAVKGDSTALIHIK